MLDDEEGALTSIAESGEEELGESIKLRYSEYLLLVC
jgi:hypothetical protein